MDERENLKREADAAKLKMNEITDELGDRANVAKRVKTKVVGSTKQVGSFVKDHPMAVAVGGGLLGLALGALLPVGKSERTLLDRVQAKMDDAIEGITSGVMSSLGAGDDDADLDDDDADVSPDMDMTAMAGEEDALDRMEETGSTDKGAGTSGGSNGGGSGGYKS